MKLLGWITAAIGLLTLLTGFAADTTARYSDTLNIGLLNDKSNLVGTGCALLICGVILIVGGSVASVIEKAVVAPGIDTTSPGSIPGSLIATDVTDAARSRGGERSPMTQDEDNFDPSAYASRKDI